MDEIFFLFLIIKPRLYLIVMAYYGNSEETTESSSPLESRSIVYRVLTK